MSQVDVQIEVAGSGEASTAYVAPTPSLLAPYHRSPVSRSCSRRLAARARALLRLLVCLLLLLLVAAPATTVVDGSQTFATRRAAADSAAASRRSARRAATATPAGWWAQLERDLELARMTMTPRQVVGISLGGTFAIFAARRCVSRRRSSACSGSTTPLIARAVIRRKLKAVRDEFADQFPATCRCSRRRSAPATASTARSASSSTTPASRPGPSSRASCRTTGSACCPEDAIRKLARRMANRDIEQVALLAELQRTSGGNSAEILDTVVATIRERRRSAGSCGR